ncbi:alpha/beta fold hydrolase [Winogradskyella wandonensis]|nr:alpha/beta hydrolase [Winogradskyella wandonensis]
MTLNYKNISINYTVKGQGKVLVLLHGFLETIDMWTDFVPELSKTRKVICIDLLGHGKTECLGYIHSMDDMAEAVFAVLKHLQIEEISCVGHSMGGYVALALAEKHPNLVNDLCLMNSTFEADDNERKILRARAAQMATTNYESLVRMSFVNLFAPESKVPFASEIKKALDIGLKTPVQGFIAGHKGMAIRPNRYDVFKSINGKKVIIIGEKDWIVDKELVLKKTKNTDIETVIFSEGHMSHIENKKELSYFLKRFVEK